MNKFSRLVLLASAALTGFLSSPPKSSAATAMQTYVSAMQPGWNLGNTLDAFPTETYWGNPLTTQALIQQIAGQGFKSIRIPVTWNDHLGPAPTYTIDPAWLNRVQQIVDWSLDAGLYVMINMHHDSIWVRTMPTNHDVVLAKFKAVWSQIAPRFRDYPNKLMFESINEPEFEGVDDATNMTLLNELNTSFFNLVRGSGGGNATRPLVLPSLRTNASQQYLDSLKATMAALNDSNLIATNHYYGFWPFSVNISGATTVNEAVVDDINQAMNNAYNTFVAKGIPVIIGEIGLLGYDPNNPGIERGEVLKFFEIFTGTARSKDITWQVWDAGQLFNRLTNQWRDPELFNYYLQSVTSRSSTAATDLVFVKSGAAADVAVPLNLNGNTFVSLTKGGVALTPGTDYTIDGSTLTLKGSLLAPYASGGYGEKVVLDANFSAGVPWKLRVRHLGAPALTAASGTKTSGLVIPAAFNGDLLATMEAKYAGMGYPYPGQAEWTSFKQYNESYVPDYTNNTITIKKEFFAATNSNPIDFVFYFWSGRTVTYSITTSGTNVTSNTPSSPPGTPNSAGAFASSATEITLSWLPPTSGATVSGYKLERATDTAFSSGLTTITLESASTSYVDTGVSGNTKYYYRLSATNSSGSSTPTTAFSATTPGATGTDPSMLVNIATRAFCGTGEKVAIAGFVIGGSGPKRVLLRAVGPTLATQGIAQGEVLADPTLQLYRGSNVIATNDDWGSNTNAAQITSVGTAIGAAALAGSDTKSAALLTSLDPGAYTFVVNGKNNSTGIVLLEVYDAEPTNTAARFVNIATRAYSTTGSGVTIGGFVVAGSRPKQVLLRAVGPTLESFGLSRSSLLADPVMEMHQGAPLIAANDNWGDNANANFITSNGARIGAASIDASDTRSSVLLAKALPGAYTFIASGKSEASGIVLVEVYDAD